MLLCPFSLASIESSTSLPVIALLAMERRSAVVLPCGRWQEGHLNSLKRRKMNQALTITSWRVLRCQVPPSDREKEDTPVLPEVTPAGEAAIDHRAAEPSADWGGGEDWGDNTDWLKQTDDTDLEKLIESSLTLADEEEEQEKISTNSTSTNSQPAKNEKEKHSGPYQCGPHSFCGFYMEVEEERMRPIVSKKEKKLAAYWIKELKSADEDDSYEDRPGNKQRKGKQMKGSKKNSGGVTEVYEETEEKHLLKFQEYLERNPEHVFRYHFAGRPLWLTREIPQSIPHCERCGAERVFECEVMPTLIYLLQSAQSFGSKEKDEAGVHLEFGCVVIFSCSQSCGQEGEYSYEFAYLQQAL